MKLKNPWGPAVWRTGEEESYLRVAGMEISKAELKRRILDNTTFVTKEGREFVISNERDLIAAEGVAERLISVMRYAERQGLFDKAIDRQIIRQDYNRLLPKSTLIHQQMPIQVDGYDGPAAAYVNGNREMHLAAGSSDYSYMGEGLKPSVIAHEYFHVLQLLVGNVNNGTTPSKAYQEAGADLFAANFINEGFGREDLGRNILDSLGYTGAWTWRELGKIANASRKGITDELHSILDYPVDMKLGEEEHRFGRRFAALSMLFNGPEASRALEKFLYSKMLGHIYDLRDRILDADSNHEVRDFIYESFAERRRWDAFGLNPGATPQGIAAGVVELKNLQRSIQPP